MVAERMVSKWGLFVYEAALGFPQILWHFSQVIDGAWLQKPLTSKDGGGGNLVVVATSKSAIL